VVKSLRDLERAPEGAPPAPDLLTLQVCVAVFVAVVWLRGGGAAPAWQRRGMRRAGAVAGPAWEQRAGGLAAWWQRRGAPGPQAHLPVPPPACNAAHGEAGGHWADGAGGRGGQGGHAAGARPHPANLRGPPGPAPQLRPSCAPVRPAVTAGKVTLLSNIHTCIGIACGRGPKGRFAMGEPKDPAYANPVYRPFMRSDQYGTAGLRPQPLLERVRLLVAAGTLVPLRFLACLCCVACYYLICRLATLTLGELAARRVITYFGKIWCRLCLLALGFVSVRWVRAQGNEKQRVSASPRSMRTAWRSMRIDPAEPQPTTPLRTRRRPAARGHRQQPRQLGGHPHPHGAQLPQLCCAGRHPESAHDWARQPKNAVCLRQPGRPASQGGRQRQWKRQRQWRSQQQ